MQDIRIIGLDLDGTLFNDKKELTPRTLAALEEACRRGILVLPATGRTLAGVPEQLLHIDGVRYALTSNGATVTELATGKKLVEQFFEPNLALAIYKALEPFDSLLDVFIDGKSYTTRVSFERLPLFAIPAMVPYMRKVRTVVEDMPTRMAQTPDKIEKFSILYGNDETRQKAWAVAETFGGVVTTSIPRNMEINAPGVTKGSGLLALAKHLGFGPAQVMACGDSGNDITMLQMAGLGVAMGNATPEIKAAADVVTADNNHDGVALAIEKYVLGKEDAE